MKYIHLTSSFLFLELKGRTFLIRTIPFQIYEVPTLEKAVELVKSLEENAIKDDFPTPYSNYFSLELILTTKCNLACKYCYARSEQEDIGYYGLKPMRMNFSTAKRAIDFSIDLLIKKMKANGQNNGVFDIYFMGGEPLLNKEVLISTMKYLKNKVENIKDKIDINVDISAAISTNGTLIDDEIARFFRDFKFSYVGITIDGERHNLYRIYKNGEGTLDDVLKGIDILNKYNVNLKLVSVVSPGEVMNISKIIEFYRSLGLYDKAIRISIVPKAPTKDEIDRACVISKEYISDIINAKDAIKFTENERKEFSRQIIEISKRFNIDERDLKKKIRDLILSGGCLYHCPAGIAKISVAPDKTIWPCHQLVNFDEFYMGTLESPNIEPVREKFLARTFFKIDKCQRCLFQSICPPLVDCPARSYIEEGNFYTTPQYCDMYIEYISNVFQEIISELIRRG